MKSNQKYAEKHGYEVHHDLNGFYVVSPLEHHVDGFDKEGKSLGFDGRPHYADEKEAWVTATIKSLLFL